MRLPDFLQPVRPGHVFALTLTHAIAYAGLLILSIIVLLAMLIGGLFESGNVTESELEMIGDLDVQLGGAWTVIAAPFQLVGSWLLGLVTISYDTESISLWAPNLLTLALGTLLALILGRRWLRGRPDADPAGLALGARVVVNAVVAAATALLSVLITLAMGIRFTESLDFGALGALEVRVSVNAAGVLMFFTTFTIFFLLGLLLCGARGNAQPGPVKIALKKAETALPYLSQVPRVVLMHLCVVGLPVILFVFFELLVAGDAALALGLLLWASVAALTGFVVLLSGPISTQGYFGTQTEWLWSAYAWWEILLAVAISLVGIFSAALIWHLSRASASSGLSHPMSSVVLPVSYLLLGLLASLFGGVRLDGQTTIGPGVWAFAFTFLAGVVIEVLSRFLMPKITTRLPRPVIQKFQK